MPPDALRRDPLGREMVVAKFETRSIDRGADGDSIPFTGTASVFNRRTWIPDRTAGFWEQVHPDAFNRSLAHGADVRLLKNHNPDYVLARTSSGTLDLTTTSDGLSARADMAPTTYARDLAILMERGDVNEMSFAFEVTKGGADWSTADDGKQLRTLREVKLFDVSVVTYPAYEGTTAAMRSLLRDVLNLRDVAPADADEDPVALAQAVDAVLDELAECLAEGDVAQCQDLLTSAETTVDQLVALLGGVDPDDTDSSAMGPRSQPRRSPRTPAPASDGETTTARDEPTGDRTPNRIHAYRDRQLKMRGSQ